jgi:hypothetical protein
LKDLSGKSRSDLLDCVVALTLTVSRRYSRGAVSPGWVYREKLDTGIRLSDRFPLARPLELRTSVQRDIVKSRVWEVGASSVKNG